MTAPSQRAALTSWHCSCLWWQRRPASGLSWHLRRWSGGGAVLLAVLLAGTAVLLLAFTVVLLFSLLAWLPAALAGS